MKPTPDGAIITAGFSFLYKGKVCKRATTPICMYYGTHEVVSPSLRTLAYCFTSLLDNVVSSSYRKAIKKS